MVTPNWTTETVYVDDAPVSMYRARLADSGEPLVFYHGWGLSPRSYRPLIDALALRGYDVHAPALPGFGGSAPLDDTGRDTLRRMAHRLKEAVASYGLDGSTPVVAHSLGGAVAIHIAQEDPSTVRGVVLICPVGGAGSHVTTWLHLAGGLRHEIFHSPVARAKDAIPAMLRHPHATALTGIAAKHADLTDAISSVSNAGIPVSIIAADHDGVVPLDRLKGLPGVPCVEVHGTHGWLIGHADECAGLTCQLLDRASAR